MIFDKTDKRKTYKYPLNWGVEYSDNTCISEYEEDGKQNDYYSINPEGINKFGLFNDNLKMYYQKDGSFMLNNQLIEIEYHFDNNIINLTASFAEKDCITFKEASTNFSKSKTSKVIIEALCFGYKTLISKNNIQLFFKPIVKAPLVGSGKVFIETRITSSEDVKGKLVFKNKGKIVEEFEFPLNKNNANIINWTVK